MGKSSYFYLSIDHKSYIYILYIFAQNKVIKISIYFYSRINRARINFYMLLVYLYREKKKVAKNGLSACYIELYIEKEKSPAIVSRGERKGGFTPSKVLKPYLKAHFRE